MDPINPVTGNPEVVNQVPTPEVKPPVTQNSPQIKNSLIFIMSLLLIISVAIAGFFYFPNRNLANRLTGSPTPAATIVPSATPDVTANWKVYTNTKYGFRIKYPDTYKALTDNTNLYGWPKAVVLFYKGGQSYDLPVEVWNTQAEYEAKYPPATSPVTVFKTTDNKYITLNNVNKVSEVDQIISTFKFTAAASASPSASVSPTIPASASPPAAPTY